MVVAVLPAERWERMAASVNGRLFGDVRARRVVRVVLLGLAGVSIVTVVANDDLRHGAKVWFACLLMLIGWTVLMVTRTVRLTSVLRLFSVAMLGSLVIVWLWVRWSTRGLLTESNAGPGIAIAGLVEETFKLLPLAALAVVAPGRVRRFTVADWLCCGLASGMGFQAAEDFVRQATYEPSLWDYFDGRRWGYGWSLFGGGFEYNEVQFSGHHISTALAAAGIGVAVVVSIRRVRWWPAVWLAPLGLWALVVCDHLGYNATARNPEFRGSVSSPIPQVVHTVWSATGYGFGRGWLLAGLALVAVLVDAGRLYAVEIARGAALFPPATVGERWLRGVGERLVAVVRDQVRRWSTVVRMLTTVSSARLAATVGALEERRVGREHTASGDSVVGRRVTRWLSMVVGVVGAVVSVQLAVALAERIGAVLEVGSDRSWFAGLLEALLDMWDDLGPPGQFGLLALGVTMMLLPGTMIVFGGMSIAGAGVVGATTVVVPAAVGAAGAVVTGTTIGLAMADAADAGVGSRPDSAESDETRSASERREELASDPSRGGIADDATRQEADAALRLEDSGQLPGPIRRDPSGNAEFIDGSGQPWDVKAFRSDYPNGYRLGRALEKIQAEIEIGENVIVDSTNLSPEHLSELRAAVDLRADWVGRVLWSGP